MLADARAAAGIAFRQGPNAVYVVGKDSPDVDVKWRADAHLPNRVAQRVDLRHQPGPTGGRAGSP
jgi:hypothetical protein